MTADGGLAPGTLKVVVSNYRAEAKDVVVLDLRRPDGAPLPPFEPGAHIVLTLPNGLERQYSLINNCRERDRYVIGVMREAPGHGTGGSEYVHQTLAMGSELTISGPQNNFRLEPDAAAYRFIAGGIGVTPIVSMVQWCIENQRPWRLSYAVRSRCRTAFYEYLTQIGGDHIVWHFDDEARTHLDVQRALDGLMPGELVYCCGPRPLMSSVREQLGTRSDSGRFESFVKRQKEPPEPAAVDVQQDKTFTVTLRHTGVSLPIPPDRSILEVLEANGVSVPFSCREGECGTCITRVCEGVPEHRDYVLTDDERGSNKMMCVCVSRSLTSDLVLDL
ncbi:MAG: PDR/VanB family oxidoreductase [Rhodoferax sp.]